MPENVSGLEDAFNLAMYQMFPLSECVSHIAIVYHIGRLVF